jgi:SAM-dependent methyltransferase
MPSITNREQADFWDGMAPTWIEIEERIESTAAVAGTDAMTALHPQPGEQILDLGCGTGGTTVAIARMVHPGGAVVGADISPEMLVRARQRAADAGLQNLEFVHADVQAADFGDGRFDGAFSRFGVMFFSDPVTAFANVRRSLRSGGRLAFACWQHVFANEWMLVPGMAVMEATGTPPPMPAEGEPGPFSLSDPERVKSLLGQAGFENVNITAHNDVLEIPAEEVGRYAATSVMVGAAREALREADDQTRRRAVESVEAALKEREDGGRVPLTRGYLVVTASS